MSTNESGAPALGELASRRPRQSASPRRSRRFVANLFARAWREREQYQDDLDRAIVDALCALGERIDALDGSFGAIGQSLDALVARVALDPTVEVREAIGELALSASRSLDEHVEWMGGLKARIERLEQDRDVTGALKDLRAAQLATTRNLRAVADQAAVDRDRAGALQLAQAELERFQAELVGDVNAEIADVRGQIGRLAELTDGLNVVPYMSDPAVFTTIGPSGELVLGFDGAGASAGNYAGFEDLFRGSEELIRERQQVYLPLVADHAPLLDLGSGRGEFLELAAEIGLSARGVDADAAMAARAEKKGLDVVEADALEYLRGLPDGAAGAIFAAQFVEHLDYERLTAVLEESSRVLRDDGVCILETVNPYSLAAFRTFWTDLTHVRPIFPEVLLALVRAAGFASARVLFPRGSGDLDRDRWREGEYAVVASKRLR